MMTRNEMSANGSSMQGKLVLVTGATNGIGKATALELATMGANVVIVGRNLDKTRATVDEIKATSQNPAIEMLQADLSSMREVRILAQEFTSRYDHLDVLVNNAGAVFGARQETVDGYEMTFALNHLSYFLLTNLLLDTLRRAPASRVVNVASSTHFTGKIDLSDLQSQRAYRLGGFGVYATSKLANVLFTYELARRVADSEITVNAIAPGNVASGFGHNNGGIMGVVVTVLHQFARTPEKGAETIVYLASSPEVAGVSGKYFEDCQPVASSKASHDATLARQLWEASEMMVGLPQSQLVGA